VGISYTPPDYTIADYTILYYTVLKWGIQWRILHFILYNTIPHYTELHLIKGFSRESVVDRKDPQTYWKMGQPDAIDAA